VVAVKRGPFAAFVLAAVLAFWPAPRADLGQLQDPRTNAPRMIDGVRPERQPHSNFDLPPR
jgi:hypothetical protein